MTGFHEKTTHAARGQWRGILGQHFSIEDTYLNGKNGPCPFCGGTDRFRFLDYQGTGSWVCNQCQPTPGTGMDFVMQHTGLTFPEAAGRVDEIIRNHKPEPDRRRPEKSKAEYLSECLALWNAAKPAELGDKLYRYLSTRGLGDIECPKNLRLHPNLLDGDGGVFPCMVARISGPDGKGASLHKTFLRLDGSGKAEIPKPRKFMVGASMIPVGASVHLGPAKADIGIAEGIETALSASQLFDLPVWSALDAGHMEKWLPPEGTETLTIFADSDASYRGQRAAFALANSVCTKMPFVEVVVKMPPALGWDWNDVLLAEQGRKPA